MAGRPRGAWADKAWRNALRVAVMRPAGEKAPKPKNILDELALSLIAAGKAGDVPALKQIGDRLDGKVPQAVVGGGEDDNPVRVITEIRRTIVDPKR